MDMTEELYALKRDAEKRRDEYVASFIGAMIAGLLRLIPGKAARA